MRPRVTGDSEPQRSYAAAAAATARSTSCTPASATDAIRSAVAGLTTVADIVRIGGRESMSVHLDRNTRLSQFASKTFFQHHIKSTQENLFIRAFATMNSNHDGALSDKC